MLRRSENIYSNRPHLCFPLLLACLLVAATIGANLSRAGSHTRTLPAGVVTRLPSSGPAPFQMWKCQQVIYRLFCDGVMCDYTGSAFIGCGFRFQPPNPENVCCTVWQA